MLNDRFVQHPCVGCGYCCKKSQCAWSYNKHGKKEVCPELEWIGTQFRCKAVDNPDLYEAVGIGAGCCSPLFNTEREKYL
jgi:hypothetical protein